MKKLWDLLKSAGRVVSAPFRWAHAALAKSRLWAWLWSLQYDPPALRLMQWIWVVPGIMIIGVALDRKFLQGDLRAKNETLSTVNHDIGQRYIACDIERGLWEARTKTAEAKAAELAKREPPSPPLPAVLPELRRLEKQRARRTKADAPPAYKPTY